MTRSIRADLQIGCIAGMGTGGVVETMLFSERVVVRAGARERSRSGARAASDGVEMNSVDSRRESRGSHIDVNNSVIALPQLRGCNASAAHIAQRCRSGCHPMATEERRRTSRNRCNRCHCANCFECSHLFSVGF
jgi:hypothetical protein